VHDPKTHEEVRENAAEATGALGDLATLERALQEAVAHGSGPTPEDGLLSALMFTTLAEAAHPKLAPGLLTLLEHAGSQKTALEASLVLALTPLEPTDQARLFTLVDRTPARVEVLTAALWATDVDMTVLAKQRAKLGAAELAKLDDSLFRMSSWTGRGPNAPERIARWAVRARAYSEKTNSDKAESALRAGLENTPLSGPGWTRTGMRRALFALAQKGNRGAVLALASWPEPGPLLALASADSGVPETIVRAARAELATHWP
jgi:hypothetical protein